MLVFLFHTMFYIIVGDNFNCQPSRLWLPLAISGAMSFCRCWCHNCEHVRVKAMCFKFTHADYYAADIFVCTDKTALNLFETKPILFGNDRVRTVCHKTVPSFKSPTSRIRLSTFSAPSHVIYCTKTKPILGLYWINPKQFEVDCFAGVEQSLVTGAYVDENIQNSAGLPSAGRWRAGGRASDGVEIERCVAW